MQPGVPATSPDSRTGAMMPMLRASVRLSSTWSALRTGPRMDTPASSRLGPTTVTRSLEAYWPGWDSIFFTVSS